MWRDTNDYEKPDSWPKIRKLTLLTLTLMLLGIVVDLLFGM